jgi:hypothetical protein
MASAMGVAKQRASVAEMCGLCSAVATACLYDGLRVRLLCRILRLSTDVEMLRLSSGKVEENHGCIRATEGEVYIRSGRKELGLEGASRCYIWDGDWVITHVPRDKPYGQHPSCAITIESK